MEETRIDWQQAADEAAQFAADVLSEATRETISWHGPTDTWLAFDTWLAENDEQRQDYIEQLLVQMGAEKIEVRECSISEDYSALAILVTNIPSGNPAIVTDLLWRVWRTVQGQQLGDKLDREARKALKKYESQQRQTASDRIGRFLTGQDNPDELEAERQYRELQDRRHALHNDKDAGHKNRNSQR